MEWGGEGLVRIGWRERTGLVRGAWRERGGVSELRREGEGRRR